MPPPVLDLEGNSKNGDTEIDTAAERKAYLALVLEWLQIVETALDRRAIIYTTASFFSKSLRDKDELKKKDDKKRAEGKRLKKDYNHKRMETVAREPTREWLCRLDIDEDGKVDADSIARGSLRGIFANHALSLERQGYDSGDRDSGRRRQRPGGL